MLREWTPWPERMCPPIFSSSSGGDPAPLREYTVDASRRLALASYSLSLLARRREPQMWPG
eukprot:4924270-Alexandrium_andersonii.AAC.1